MHERGHSQLLQEYLDQLRPNMPMWENILWQVHEDLPKQWEIAVQIVRLSTRFTNINDAIESIFAKIHTLVSQK